MRTFLNAEKLARLVRFAGCIPILSSTLRWYASRYEEGTVVQIRSGYGRGQRWKRYHRYVNGYWTGQYELPIQDALARELRAGQTFYDVGANAGFFTLVAATFVGEKGRCVAFDPSPINISTVQEQLALNGLSNCQTAEEAIGDYCGQADFAFDATDSSLGHIGKPKGSECKLIVKIATLDDAISRFGKPHLIKIDVEGGERSAIRGAAKTLAEVKPIWLIECTARNAPKR